VYGTPPSQERGGSGKKKLKKTMYGVLFFMEGGTRNKKQAEMGLLQ
jgi:hypothetical protein